MEHATTLVSKINNEVGTIMKDNVSEKLRVTQRMTVTQSVIAKTI